MSSGFENIHLSLLTNIEDEVTPSQHENRKAKLEKGFKVSYRTISKHP
jgi:hypothetical protein